MMSRPRWPDVATQLFAELASSPGRLALVVGPDGAGELLRPLSEALDLEITSAGRVLTQGEKPPTAESARALLAEARLIDDADILFAPELALDPLGLVRDLARRHPVVLNWPGTIAGGEGAYSEPGRRDHYQRRLADAVILYPVAQHFPDQPPYNVRRIP